MRSKLLISVFGVTHWKDLKNIFVDEAKKIKGKKEAFEFSNKWLFYLYFDSSNYTLKNRSLEMRKELLSNNIDEVVVNLFKLPGEYYNALNAKDEEIVKAVLTDDFKSDFNYEVFVDETIKKFIEIVGAKEISLNSSSQNINRELSYYKMFVLALATGRRQIEILRTLEISKKKDLVIYNGLAKKNNKELAKVEAPILMDLNLAKKWLKDIREEFKITEEMTNKEVNSKYNGSIGKALVRIFKDIEIKEFHFFRTCYAETCYKKFGGEKDKELYFAEILGHEIALNHTHNYLAKGKKGISARIKKGQSI